MKKYAKVIVRSNTIYTDNLFTYQIPVFLSDVIKIGHRILVRFGKGNKPTEAFVFQFTDSLDEKIKIKEIIDILDENPIFRKEDLELVYWMKNRYLCTYIECINLIYPKGYKLNNYKVVLLGESLSGLNDIELKEKISTLSDKNREIVEKVIDSKGKIKVDKLKYIPNLNSSLYTMNKNGIIKLCWEYKNHKNEKKVCYISLSLESDKIDDYIEQNKINVGSKQKEILSFLKNNENVEINDLLDLLNASKQSINSLSKKKLITLEFKDYYREPKSIYKSVLKSIKLNNEQQEAVDEIKSNMFVDDKKPYLIHGVTGSGKTEVYMEIIEFALNQGLDSIFLVPEIALTPQTIDRLKSRFGDLVGVFHSKLSEGEKHDVYKAVKAGKVRVLIGARSALFAPFNSLGLIIIDECHESSYKSEKNPKFNAIEVARFMALKNNITLILGSATPSIEEYYRAKSGEYKLINIKSRANDKPLPNIEVVDMKDELDKGNRSIFSLKLQKEIRYAIEENNQVILFLNRRGYANFVSCRKCGYVFQCENCDISLTYHKKSNTGRCHYCGYEKEIPKECPECKSTYVKPFGVGTQKIEEELKYIFPDIKTLRMDKDTTSKKGALDEILNKFKDKEADVLIGTQMLSKGLDFENVTLVGILSADMILNFPDFKSFETTFQLITQVSGRAGRADKEGKVVLQTYDTEHYAIKHAIEYDYEGFYEDEIKIRKAFGYSPFNNMLSVVVSGEDERLVIKNIKNMHASLIYLLEKRGINDLGFILGPNPCSISKINQNYRWQILFKDENIEINLLKGIIKYICITKRDLIFDKNINVSIDINPNSVL
ncbi:primosomal protein N' [Clostridioides difficile]|uniref:primosomal protein N' n=1 Tax=Clostridioides difficile TaxID=1496 RepID=UPI00097FFD24|nr:primosomal protein N' [Clostridioides difficile]SJN62487.1 Primosomal protein N' [Clostridioides difficile]SJW63766.1 primosomal protein N' [Clostridioides difficile]VHR54007.1 primosomal protein N' [Clostridioides difficile]